MSDEVEEVEETAEVEEVEEVEALEESEAAAKPRSRGAITVLVLCALLAGAALGWLIYLHSRPAPTQQLPNVDNAGVYTPGTIADKAGAAAVAAAVHAVPVALSYDYRSLDSSLQAALPLMTPGFQSQFTQTFDSVVKPAATKNQAVVKGLVRAAGLANRSGDSATVLVFLDEALVSSGGKASPKISQDRVRVTMIRSNGSWLVDAINPF